MALSIVTGPVTQAPGPPDFAARPSMHQIAHARIIASLAKHHGAHPLLALMIAHQEQRQNPGSHVAAMSAIHALSHHGDPGV